ncbi:MAG: FtsH protease modulator HflK, partial [Pseudomonadota bacterium]
AQRFRLVQAEYAKAPQVTRERMYLDTMQQVYGNVSKVLVDTKQGSNMLYLPLDKVMQLSAQAEPTAAVAAPAPAAVSNGSPANAGAAASRSRESDRSRDRDVR